MKSKFLKRLITGGLVLAMIGGITPFEPINKALDLVVTAQAAEIGENDLKVFDTYVTSENANDILGNGLFSYDIENKVLTIKGNYTPSDSSNNSIINVKIDDLTISVKNDSVIDGKLFLCRSTTVTGKKLTLKGNDCGVYIINSSTITLKDADIEISGSENGIYWPPSLNRYGGSLIIDNSDFKAQTQYAVIAGVCSGITVSGKKKITSPAGAYIKDSNIYNHDGTIANEVVIEEGESEEYAIRIAGTLVTDDNRMDILGDGACSYDPVTNTLTLKKDIKSTDSNFVAIESDIDGLIINAQENVTILSAYSDNIAMYFRKNITITGQGKINTYGSIGIDNGTLTIKEADITAASIFGNSAAKLIIDDSNIISTSGIKDFDDIALKNAFIIKPENGIIPSDQYVEIEKAQKYDLYIFGTQVNAFNAGDILGDGVFDFDPETNTLNIHGNCSTADEYAPETVLSNINGLTVNVVSDSVLSRTGGHVFDLSGDTTITGSGKLTVSTNDTSAISLRTSKLKLTIQDILMDIDSHTTGGLGAYCYGIYMLGSTLTFNNSYVNISADGGAIIGQPLQNGTKSSIVFTNSEVTSPVNYKNIDGKIYESDGTTRAKDVKISSTNVVVTLNAGNGSGESKEIIYTKNTDYILPECTFTEPEGKKFIGWKAEGVIYQPGEACSITGDITFFAQWESNYCTFAFQDRTGTNNDHIVYVTKKQNYKLPECTFFTAPEGYEFDTWEINGKYFDPGYSSFALSNLNIYAVWKTKECSVTFDTNGLGTVPETQTVLYNNTVSAPTVLPVGNYNLTGWYTDGDYTSLFSFSTPITDDITLYGKWEKANNTVTADGTNKTAAVYYGDDITIDPTGGPDGVKWRIYIDHTDENGVKKTEYYKFGDVFFTETLPIVVSADSSYYKNAVSPEKDNIVIRLEYVLPKTSFGQITLDVKYKDGDFNKNGKLDEEDATLMLKHISGIEQLDEEQFARADVNGDGEKDMRDVIAILKFFDLTK